MDRCEEFRGRIVQQTISARFSVFESHHSPQERCPEHSHQRPYISITLAGSYRENYGAEVLNCPCGQTIMHASGETHSDIFGDRGARVLSLAVHPSYLTELERLGFDFTKRRIAATARCLQLAMRIRQEALSGNDAVSHLEIEGLGIELCAEIFREHAKQIAGESDWLARADQIIHDRFREQIRLTELAAEVGVHPVHLARAFRKRYGRCIGEQIRQLRVDTACSELTHSQLPIVDISARSGFSDQSHFCRTFKRYVGVSPHQFRIGVPADRNLDHFRLPL